MSGDSQRILHRMVPLICQALTTSPTDDLVWQEGLRLLCNPKLRNAMAITSSIWLPLLIKGLEPSRPKEVVLAALRLLTGVTETLEPMKSCLVKPLRLLGKDQAIGDSEELGHAVEGLGIMVWNSKKVQIGRRNSSNAGSAANTPLPPVTPVTTQPTRARDHPLVAEMLARNLPSKSRSVKSAWTSTLLASTNDRSSMWLHQLYQATLEACAVPEMVIASRLGAMVHGDLFQTAFLKCYTQIKEDKEFKDLVDSTMEGILLDPTQTHEILCVLLDLVAFFDKAKYPLPSNVVEAAHKCAFDSFQGELEVPLPAVCLWYIERNTAEDLTAANIANLVKANIRMGASGYDAAWSSLLWRRDDYDAEPEPFWITHLSHWTTALEQQERIDGGQVTTFEAFQTRMTCHHALGQFERGYDLAQRLFEGLTDGQRRRVSHWACAAAWHMGDYEAMADFLAFHGKGTSKSLYKAIIDVHHGQYASAFHHISKGQTLSYDEVHAQLEQSPQAAHKSLAKSECLVELQEVIQYKSQPELREHIRTVWRNRFKRSHADANSWLKRLQIWRLACPPTELDLQRCYLDTAKLCESSGMHDAAERLLNWVRPEVSPPGCKVEYTQMRFDWKKATEKQDQEAMLEVLQRLHAHMDRYLDSLNVDRSSLENEGLGLRPLVALENVDRATRNILARRYYRAAQWTEMTYGPSWLTDPDSQVYRYYSLTYKLDDLWFNGAYSLAQAAMNIFEANSSQRTDRIAVNSYVVPAIRGLFQSVRSRETPEKMIKALLRLVTLWFRYGECESVLVEVEHQLSETPISAWLMAIPQLIARLGTLHRDLQGLLIELLKDIARQYPHAVIWPLLTASQTRKEEHEKAARVIMDYICQMQDGTTLVQQAEMVGRELIRTSISWTEKWRNTIDRCLPRTDVMEIAWHEVPATWEDEIEKLDHPETPDEEHFVQTFGVQIQSIYKILVRYRTTRQLSYVNTAYTDLYKLYFDFDTQLNQWRASGAKLQLTSTAPRLLALRECILTVPGQYDPNMNLDDQAFIESFIPSVDMLQTKQIPRKLVIRSMKKDYTFLLKGNEDLRGDERIMQLFTLINTLLNHNSAAFSRNLHLLPYEVVPLSPSAGLVSWVENTQQLQAMILSNREKDKNNNLSNKEVASILGYDPENFDTKHDRPRLDPPAEMDRYDKLPLATKVERLKAALSHSKQMDLKEVLWSRSPSADIWIQRRTNFARTIGVGSFVGYVIGLGDRHGSNILVDQLTWGALHIDFGDLFETAQERAILPEKVPFRLTRMMTNAMELSTSHGHEIPGSRGSFKQSSIICMSVLRESRSSLLAMLEAFLYDPLLSWTANAVPSEPVHDSNATAKVDGGQAAKPKKSGIQQVVAQSVAPAMGPNGSETHIYNQIDNSLIVSYLDTDSYMAKASTGITNAKALHVLARIESKLAGYTADGDTIMAVKKQVQRLIIEATSIENLAQGYVLGWLPYW